MADYVKLAHDNTIAGGWEPDEDNGEYPDDVHILDLEMRIAAAIEGLSLQFNSAEPLSHDDLLRMMNGPQKGHRERQAKMDTVQTEHHTESMNDITREEFNAKLETIEVKMDARVESVSAKIDSFLSAQAERDKAQLERDKRYELLSDRVTKAAEGAEAAAKQAATVKSNYWAAVGVQLLAVAAILVGAYFATQANTLSAISTTLSAFQAGKAESAGSPSPPSAPAK